MTTEDVAGLTAMAAGFRDRDLFPALLRLLAEGRAVDRERIAVAARCALGELDSIIAGLPTDQWDAEGRMLGLGITLIPTPHRFIVGGRVLYTWCALDALMFPAVIGQSAEVESACPETRTPTSIKVYPDRLGEFSPPRAVATRALSRKAVLDIRTSGCALGNFFASAGAAEGWQRAHSEGSVLPLSEELASGLAFVKAIGWA